MMWPVHAAALAGSDWSPPLTRHAARRFSRVSLEAVPAEKLARRFAREFVGEYQTGAPTIKAMRRISQSHQIEQVGEKLRGMMPWIQEKRLVDRDKN